MEEERGRKKIETIEHSVLAFLYSWFFPRS